MAPTASVSANAVPFLPIAFADAILFAFQRVGLARSTHVMDVAPAVLGSMEMVLVSVCRLTEVSQLCWHVA